MLDVAESISLAYSRMVGFIARQDGLSIESDELLLWVLAV
jgi:hypothetical protein